MSFALIVFLAVAGVIAAVIAAMAGFGIGSLLMPVVALSLGAKTAVAVVAVPHLAGSALRLWLLRRHVDRRVLLGFGLASAAGGLAGALLFAGSTGATLQRVFGVLLVLTALSELTGWMQRVRWGRRAAWVAGAVSGALGGLVGNQGGIRAASMLGFEVRKESFVATATAVAVVVDLVRLPVYLATRGAEIAAAWPLVLVATAAVLAGTVLGVHLLDRLPAAAFRRGVAVLLLALGVWMIASA